MAQAEGQSTKRQAGVLEEVIVSAQRREQSLQDVPVSVTAFSAEQIERQNIRGTADYLISTPNVNYTEDGEGGRRGLTLSVRGVSNLTDAETNTTNAIAIYVDDLNVAATANIVANPQLGDIERIEVLRGPQGTLFGRNASGGALNITTKKPSEELYGEISVSAERFEHYGASGVLNVPLTDKLFVRGVVGYEQGDGEIKNISGLGEKKADFDSLALRLSLRYLFSDSLTADFSYSYADENQNLDNNVATGVLVTSARRLYPRVYGSPCSSEQNSAQECAIDEGTGFYSSNEDKTSKDFAEVNDNDVDLANLRLTWSFDGLVFRSITGYTDTESVHNTDLDGTAEDLVSRLKDREAETFSQEFRADIEVSEQFRFTAGAMYADEEFTVLRGTQAGENGFGRTPPGGFVGQTYDTFENESWALFADATWSLNEKFEIIGGLRYTEDKITVGLASGEGVYMSGGPTMTAPLEEDSSDFDDVSGRFVINFRPMEDILFYASYATAYKAGGTQLNDPIGSISANTPFDEEKVESFEIGLKATLFDNRLRLNASAFMIEWDDLQVESFFVDLDEMGNLVSGTLTQNATSAENNGIEIEVVAAATDNLTLGFNLGYLDSEFGDFDNAVVDQSVVDLTGMPLPQAPEFTANVFAEYRYSDDLGAEWFGRLDYMYRDETTSNIEGAARDQLENPDFPFLIPSFEVTNLSVGRDGNNWRAIAYVNNIFDEQYYTGTREDFGFSGVKVRPHFREYGVKITKYF